MPRRDQLFESVTTEGALLPSDFLNRLAQRDREIQGLTPDAYHLGSGEKLNEAISRSWNRVLGVWKSFSPASQQLPASDAGTTLTREKWLLPLFQELGYGRLQTAKPFEFEGRRYSISHGWQHTPIHLVSFRADLDTRSENIAGARTTSPHSMVQEFLNRSTPHLWAIVSNGHRLRVLRDNVSLTRQAFVEFDLQSMMQGELYADFALLWLLLHQSRVEGDRTELCWLEKWTQEARQRGARALDHLRVGVEEAITALGSGFLAHPANTALRDKLIAGTLTKQDYFRQLLRVVYRFLFLFAAEDRELLHAAVPEDVTPAEREALLKIRANYLRHYSISRLRRIANRLGGTQHADLWHNIRLLFIWLGSDIGCPALGLPALGSFLWSIRATPDLDDCLMANRDLLIAIRALAFTEQNKVRRPIDYKNIGTEELGSIYESLLEQHPDVHVPSAKFILGTHAGNERKTTGSHYTPPSLVNCLLDSALEPVLQERERDFSKLGFKSAEDSILSLKVCDKAVGSGHFLIGAAHRIAKRLAAVRTGDGEPSPTAIRHALRDVIGRCLYGVDTNPMAVELCKFALWLEALEPGKPLSFLDHHIQCGNSLLGATPALMAQGIPDAAFEPIEGDDKKYCANFKKENRKELRQDTLFDRQERPWEHLGNLTLGLAQLASLPDDSVADVHAKENHYAELVRSSSYESGRQLADAWCAAFVWKKCPPAAGGFDYPITNDSFQKLERNPHDAPKWMREEIKRLAEQYQFFHWHLAFPDVFHVPSSGQKPENELCGWNGGFDVNLGNPPWERVKLQEKEWFALRRPDIASAPTAAARKKLIQSLLTEDPELSRQFAEALRQSDGESQILRDAGLYPLCGRGDINVYAVFAELMRNNVNTVGRVGCVLPSGIATDDTTKFFFQDLVEKGSLVSLFSFENEEYLFPNVHHSMKFCILTLVGPRRRCTEADFIFYARQTTDLADYSRRFTLSADDIGLLNPNTRTCPIFRSKGDAELTKRIYRRVPVLIVDSPPINPWKVSFLRMFDSANDSNLFRQSDDLETEGFKLIDGRYCFQAERFVPLYEAKMLGHFDHRAAHIVLNQTATVRQAESDLLSSQEHNNPSVFATPRYWVKDDDVSAKLIGRWNHSWLVGWRDITAAISERTTTALVLPKAACADTILLMLPAEEFVPLLPCLIAAQSSFVFDYVSRQKLGGIHLKYHVFKQLATLPPTTYTQPCDWTTRQLTLQAWLLPRVLELTYTAWDLGPFAVDCGWSGPPFRWNEERRFLLRCELDAAFFHLYGLNRDDTAYILDTFPIVKRKDEAKFGDYRTKLIILKIYDDLATAVATKQPYRTRLDPEPASILVTHLPKLPTVERVPLDASAKYIAQFILSALKLHRCPVDARWLAEAFSLVASRSVCAELAKAEFGDLGQKWIGHFNENTKPDEFRAVLCGLYDKDIIDMNDIGNKPMVWLKITDPVPDNVWVELDVLLLAKLMAIVPADINYETPVVMPDSKSKILAHAA
jgi:hypothetical protein